MSSPEPPGKTALIIASDFIKYTTGFATGALVFSAELLNKDVSSQPWTKYFLIGAWVLLTLSAITGVLTYSRIPIQIAEENYNIEDKWFIRPGRTHQVTFILGILTLGIVLILIMFSNKGNEVKFKVVSAEQAVKMAKSKLTKDNKLLRIMKIELLPGIVEANPKLPVWNVEFEVENMNTINSQDSVYFDSTIIYQKYTRLYPKICKCKSHPEQIKTKVQTINYFIDAATGDVLQIP